jgi:hypothetical protein
MNRRALPFVLLALAAATGACDVETTARGSTAATEPHLAPDAGSGARAGASAGGDDDVVDLSEPVMGLTRAQVRARRGPPTQIRGNEWIYTPPEQEGCRDVIISEVLTFKGDVVVKFRLQRKQTGKVCRGR